MRRFVGLDAEQLVDLFLVLDHGEADLGMVEDESHLLGDRVLVQRHRHRAQRLGRGHGPIQPRPVVADNGDLVARLQAERGEAAGQRAHFLGDLAPSPGLPDAQILFPGRRLPGPPARVFRQQLGKSVERRGARGLSLVHFESPNLETGRKTPRRANLRARRCRSQRGPPVPGIKPNSL